ncbi:hypothetical protein [Salinispira pacifica]|uniref:FecR protein domain-containing protein n=1 Tax=Salinispira pacifica TaxID=1307761 RepID=V5WHZ6_9SPIO|nr:hypothetical protein [Salinispira pacifica]AHC15418.1 hypothetical protein L21SP2_2049 [Salinispira pacifica]
MRRNLIVKTRNLAGNASVLILIGMVSALLFIGCGSAAESASEGQSNTRVVEQELEAIAVSPESPAVVVFLLGEVEVYRDGTWSSLEIGSQLRESDRVRTGPAAGLEIQLADLALIVLENSTEILLRSINIRDGLTSGEAELLGGTIVSKVRALSEQESFRIRGRTRLPGSGVRRSRFNRMRPDQPGSPSLKGRSLFYHLRKPSMRHWESLRMRIKGKPSEEKLNGTPKRLSRVHRSRSAPGRPMNRPGLSRYSETAFRRH